MKNVDEDVRVAVYARLSTTGLEPTVAELAADTGLDVSAVAASLDRLHGSRDLVLRDGHIVMAHPFATIPLGFSVMGTKTLWWGGCAWDSFALPHLLATEPDVLVATRCRNCDAPHAWVVGRSAPPSGSQVAHFLVPVTKIWDDVVHTCDNQRIFCDSACVDAWLERTGQPRGYEMDLATLWRLAQGWYAGRLDHGYQRRDPSSASAYFASVGLTGPFWGLA